MKKFSLLLLILFLFPSMVLAAGPYYVDSGSTTGLKNGSATSPACSIYNISGAINTELMSADVTVYFSAAATDGLSAEAYTGNSAGGCSTGASAGQMDLSIFTQQKTATHRLTFDGVSYYNTNHGTNTGSWVANNTGFRSTTGAWFSQNGSHFKYSKMTINGFYANGGGAKSMAICGDSVYVTNNEVIQSAGSATHTLAILIVPNGDGLREGSTDWCPIMDDVQITGNYIHDTNGEAIYVGGGSCRRQETNGYDDGSGATFNTTSSGGSYVSTAVNAAGSGYRVNQQLFVRGNSLGGADQDNDLRLTITGVNDSGGAGIGGVTTFGSVVGTSTGSSSWTNVAATNNCDGFPSHTNVIIANNIIERAGINGNEGDGIDVKGGLTGLRIYGNEVTDNRTYSHCIVVQGANISDTLPSVWIYGNTCHDQLLATSEQISFANSWGTPSGISMFNNLVYNNPTEGLRIYDCVTCAVYNNVFYNNVEDGINQQSAAGINVKNNVLLANNASGVQATLAGTYTSTNNAYGGSWTGTCTSCQTGVTTFDFVDAAGGDFRPASSSSKLYLTGADLTSVGITPLDSDYAGAARPSGSAWDIGAYQLGNTPTVGGGGTLSTSAITPSTLTLSWTKATDPIDPQNLLQYEVGQSTSSIAAGVSACEASSIIQAFIADINSFAVTGLTGITQYYFCVVVKNLSGLKAAYTPTNATTQCGASKVVFSSQPSGAFLGASIGTVGVTVKNSVDATCTDSSAAIALANTGGTCTGMTLTGTASGNASSGIFSTTSLAETVAAGSCTLTATSSGLTSVISNSFAITIAPSGAGAGKRIRALVR